MPVFNGERYIAEAISSVLSQTLYDWELIIVNDGSTDETSAIIDKFSDARIRVIHQSNRGEGAARNTALHVASGTYLAFLDADDLFMPIALESYVMAFAQYTEADVIFANGHMVDESGAILMCLSELRPRLYTGWILEPLILHSTTVSVPSCMAARRRSIEVNAARFDESLRYGVDWDFWTQLARFCQFQFLDQVVSVYRVHEQNMTSAAVAGKRRQELAEGRVKLMTADWFGSLSSKTRSAFFHYLLVDLLGMDCDRQSEVIDAEAFKQLPMRTQAYLLQQIAGQHLIAFGKTRYVTECLDRAFRLNPDNLRVRLLRGWLKLEPASCRQVVRLWKSLHSWRSSSHFLNRSLPRSVPNEFMPKPVSKGPSSEYDSHSTI